MSKTGIMVCGHGSRNQNAAREFATVAEGLRARYPDEMTIVIQHTYWNLEVGDNAFEIDLSFDADGKTLTISDNGSGMTKEEIASGSQTIIIFMVCLFFVYMLLAAQYESYLLPLPVILSLPAGIFGSFLFLQLFHQFFFLC